MFLLSMLKRFTENVPKHFSKLGFLQVLENVQFKISDSVWLRSTVAFLMYWHWNMTEQLPVLQEICWKKNIINCLMLKSANLRQPETRKCMPEVQSFVFWKEKQCLPSVFRKKVKPCLCSKRFCLTLKWSWKFFKSNTTLNANYSVLIWTKVLDPKNTALSTFFASYCDT